MNRIEVLFCFLLLFTIDLSSQELIKGVVKDKASKEAVIGATVLEKGTTNGGITDIDGAFQFKSKSPLPITLVIQFVGYVQKEITVSASGEKIKIELEEEAIDIEGVEIVGQRISEKQKSRPLTVEAMDLIAIKETPADNFYDGLGNLKGVDLTAASLGFKVINTRGFNSTSPVRSLQLIDGIDNQAPGLNFSLGNFLGSPELDVQRVEIVAGASSSFYGPNAFNGVINIENKNPFFTAGTSASIKVGERSMTEVSARYADVIKNKEGLPAFAYKFNVFYLTADDWEAENYSPVDDSPVGENNPGGFDAVNIYGDEFSANFSETSTLNEAGLGRFYRTGYREIDLVDYSTENLKANAAFHFRLKPDQQLDSPELILGSNVGTGTTVYQGDNRFRLQDILFLQHKIVLRKTDKYFVRAYMTSEDAGNSYDPYATALQLQSLTGDDNAWIGGYTSFWKNNLFAQMLDAGYVDLSDDFTIGPPPDFIGMFDPDSVAAAEAWLASNQSLLASFHQIAADTTNLGFGTGNNPLLMPGTQEFMDEFNRITSARNNEREGGTMFYDKSKLYHIQGEYRFQPAWTNVLTVGGNGRLYTPVSDGTIFSDTAGIEIRNSEFGLYTGIEKKMSDDRLTMNATIRMDKNENFKAIFTPALSFVWKPRPNNFIRFSFASALRNPTLIDQYQFLNVGPAILSGNLNGVDSLVTLESFGDFRNSQLSDDLVYFNIDPIQPEKVKTFELGYRTTINQNLYLDAGYYYSIYDDFLGFNIGIDLELDQATSLIDELQVFRYSANSTNQVTTQGFSLGANYYFRKYYSINGNYSWNKLNKDFEDDPIIPAFNTPEHKYNIGISGRDIPITIGEKTIQSFGFNLNYKWIEGFIFEGSPQFTGFIPTYDLLDAQINYRSKRLNSTFKLGATNILDNKQFQTYGGPRIGRLAYFSISYELKKNN
ncbi:MAG: TonB-dependent receptor [Bacteroidota bacterium]